MESELSSHKSDKLLINSIDYFFWVVLILYTNPGGIFEALNVWHVLGRFNINDLLFVLLTICYIIIPKNHDSSEEEFKKIRFYLFVFLIYYFVVFVYLVPFFNMNKDYSLLIALTKSRWTLYSIFLFIYIYEFFKRRGDIFLRVFLFSSVAILIIFIQGILTGSVILPIDLENREFVNINRNLMFSYGLMPLLIPFGVITYVFKLRIKNKNLIMMGFVLMSIAWLISITRRHILGIIIYIILAILINTFITDSFKVFFTRVLKSLFILSIILIISVFVFPKVVNAARISIVETINIIEHGKETRGYKDERLGLRPFIVTQFLKHPLLGTGFDNRWRTSEGDKLGYEASDYPFIAALAMFGVIGIMVFLPVYILIIKFIVKDLKTLRNNKYQNNMSLLLLLTFILFFIYDLLQYPNYFAPVSNTWQYIWYVSLAFYLAARYRFYILQDQNMLACGVSTK